MTNIIYLGPSDSVNVEPYGIHLKDQEKEYPDEFAAELLGTSKKQQFEGVDVKPPKEPAKNPKKTK